jgi:hypothetical protein
VPATIGHEGARMLAEGPAGEWWRTTELSADGAEDGGPPGRVCFVDPQAADGFAQFLLVDGASAVAIEHWRAGSRVGISFVGRAARL